jgi:hypothetical protein
MGGFFLLGWLLFLPLDPKHSSQTADADLGFPQSTTYPDIALNQMKEEIPIGFQERFCLDSIQKGLFFLGSQFDVLRSLHGISGTRWNFYLFLIPTSDLKRPIETFPLFKARGIQVMKVTTWKAIA